MKGEQLTQEFLPRYNKRSVDIWLFTDLTIRNGRTHHASCPDAGDVLVHGGLIIDAPHSIVDNKHVIRNYYRSYRGLQVARQFGPPLVSTGLTRVFGESRSFRSISLDIFLKMYRSLRCRSKSLILRYFCLQTHFLVYGGGGTHFRDPYILRAGISNFGDRFPVLFELLDTV